MKLISCLALLVLMAAGCSHQNNNGENETKVLARVGDSYVSQAEFDYQLNKLLGMKAELATKEVKKKILESIVISKLMSQKQLSVMNTEELDNLHLELAIYKDDILTKKYLEKTVTPSPPSKQDVSDFYNNNLHKFGGGHYANVEHLILKDSCNVLKKDVSVKELKAKLRTQECILGSTNHNEIVSVLVRKLKINESDLQVGKQFWLQEKGQQKVLIVNALETKQARPLVEVATDIRKMLAPMQLRNAIEVEKQKLIKDMEIEYFD